MEHLVNLVDLGSAFLHLGAAALTAGAAWGALRSRRAKRGEADDS
ncbi:hypothetical protein [Streptomyces sp. NPDC127098]